MSFQNRSVLHPKIVSLFDEYYDLYTRENLNNTDQGAYVPDILSGTYDSSNYTLNETNGVNNWIDSGKGSSLYSNYKYINPLNMLQENIKNIAYYNKEEPGITHPTTHSTIKLRNNGAIDLFANTNIGIRIDPNTRSINLICGSFKIDSDNVEINSNNLKITDTKTISNLVNANQTLTQTDTTPTKTTDPDNTGTFDSDQPSVITMSDITNALQQQSLQIKKALDGLTITVSKSDMKTLQESIQDSLNSVTTQYDDMKTQLSVTNEKFATYVSKDSLTQTVNTIDGVIEGINNTITNTQSSIEQLSNSISLNVTSHTMTDATNKVVIVNCDDPAITYEGPWVVISDNSNESLKEVQSSDASAKLTYNFTGTGIRITSHVNVDRGKANIIIDGTTYTTDFYSDAELYKFVLFQKVDLTYGAHVLEIDVTDTKNNESVGTIISIDTIQILTSLIYLQGKDAQDIDNLTQTIEDTNAYLTLHKDSIEEGVTQTTLTTTVNSAIGTANNYTDQQIGNTNDNVTLLSERIQSAEQKITADAITQTVTNSETYTNTINTINQNITDVQQAVDTINTVSNAVVDANSLTPVEKQTIKKEMDNITLEKANIDAQADTCNIDKSVYDNIYQSLYNYITPLLSNMDTIDTIDRTVFDNKFNDYYTNRSTLLKTISDTENSVANAAQQAADDAQAYAQSLENDVTYKVEIISTDGLIFKNDTDTTTLIAIVYKGQTDVTNTIDSSRFRWTIKSDDATFDDSWNAAHYGGSRQITVTQSDVINRATFKCQILDASLN